MIGNMIAHTTLYPLTPNPKDILAAFDEDNFKNNFCGDVQVRGEYPSFIFRYFKELILILLILQKKMRRF